eukprot:151545_1
MTSFCLLLLIIFSWVNILSATDADVDGSALKAMELNPILYPPLECYSSELRIGKRTLATTDSYRDTDMIQLIFPEAKLEYIPHFHQDECARASKLYLPYTCFKFHAPQTWQFDEGYLSVKTLETEYTKKFYAVLNGYSQYSFDAFFDNNVAFWVSDLDKYLQQINDNQDTLQSYIGLQWYHQSTDKTFYSLIIQSPRSQHVFELMSFNEPNVSLYPNLRDDFHWQETRIPRASFKQYPDGEYPWTGVVGTLYKLGLPIRPDIVPIRISYACSDIDEQINFYTQIMEATVLEKEYNVVDVMDNVTVSYAFLKPFGDGFIEIQYVERPMHYTYGVFSVATFSNLLSDTHNDRVSGIYCGLDRWVDNHYGFDTTLFYEDDAKYMDRVFFKLVNGELKARIYYVDHQRDEAWIDSDDFDINEVDDLHGLKYKLFVFDANGQTIQMIGYFEDTYIEDTPPIYSKQWCATACPHNQAMGVFEASKVYHEDTDDVVYQIVMGSEDDSAMESIHSQNTESRKSFIERVLIIVIPIAVIIISTIVYCVYRCCAIHTMNGANGQYDPERQCLLPKQ